MSWIPLERYAAVLPREIVRAGDSISPGESFAAMVNAVRAIDYDRPRVLYDVTLAAETDSASYVDVLTGSVIHTSDDIATPTAYGTAWRLRVDMRGQDIDVRVRIYDTSGTLVQTVTSSVSGTYAIDTVSATIALSGNTTYRVDVDARYNAGVFGTGYVTHLRIAEEAV